MNNRNLPNLSILSGDAKKIRGVPIQTGAPLDDDILVYNQTLNIWEYLPFPTTSGITAVNNSLTGDESIIKGQVGTIVTLKQLTAFDNNITLSSDIEQVFIGTNNRIELDEIIPRTLNLIEFKSFSNILFTPGNFPSAGFFLQRDDNNLRDISLYFGDQSSGINHYEVGYHNDGFFHIDRLSGGNSQISFNSNTGVTELLGNEFNFKTNILNQANLYIENNSTIRKDTFFNKGNGNMRLNLINAGSGETQYIIKNGTGDDVFIAQSDSTNIFLPNLTLGANNEYLSIDGFGEVQRQQITFPLNPYVYWAKATDITITQTNNTCDFITINNNGIPSDFEYLYELYIWDDGGTGDSHYYNICTRRQSDTGWLLVLPTCSDVTPVPEKFTLNMRIINSEVFFRFIYINATALTFKLNYKFIDNSDVAGTYSQSIATFAGTSSTVLFNSGVKNVRLVDLVGVNINSPLNNQVLTYNTSQQKWINQVIPTPPSTYNPSYANFYRFSNLASTPIALAGQYVQMVFSAPMSLDSSSGDWSVFNNADALYSGDTKIFKCDFVLSIKKVNPGSIGLRSRRSAVVNASTTQIIRCDTGGVEYQIVGQWIYKLGSGNYVSAYIANLDGTDALTVTNYSLTLSSLT